jgi:hypothetical protein
VSLQPRRHRVQFDRIRHHLPHKTQGFHYVLAM